MTRIKAPKDGPGWMRWVEQSLERLDRRRYLQVPVGGMVLWPGGSTLPPGWYPANGFTFDADEFPVLATVLPGLTLPNPAAVSGHDWIIRLF